MKNYTVYVPITGIVKMEVKAENEEEAKEIALEDATLTEVEEWEAHEEIVRGNVFYGVQNTIELLSILGLFMMGILAGNYVNVSSS